MSEPRRLHPAAIVSWWLDEGARALLPSAGAIVALRLLGLAIVAGVLVAVALVRWLRFRYALLPDVFLVEGGLLFRWRRVIPLARVQSVDLVEKLRHRLLGVVELRVEVIGGQKTEAALVSLKPEEAERLRSALLPESPGPRAPVLPEPPLAQMRARDLLLAGVTGGRVPVLISLVAGAFELIPEKTLDRLGDRIEAIGIPPTAVVMAAILAVLLVSVLVSLVATTFAYWNFTVRRAGDHLVIERGLFEARRGVVPLRRIQAVRIEENLLRRLLGLASLTVVVAGYAGKREEVRESSMLLPIARRGEAAALAQRILGISLHQSMELDPAPLRALRRRLFRAAAVAAAIGAPLAALSAPIAWPALSAAPLLGLWAVASWRGLGHRVIERHVIARYGTLVRRTSIARVENIQMLSLTASPFQRVAGLATLRFKVPKFTVKAVDLDCTLAKERFAAASAAVLPA